MISLQHFDKKTKKCYCQTPELIENYEQAINDNTQIWECHHRDEIRTLPSGMNIIRTRDELIENERYYNCPPNELIFLTKSEHMKIHGATREDELSKQMKDYNKNRIWSEESKKKIGIANKNRKWTEESRKKASSSHTGKTITPRSDFGKKFKEHFGISCYEDTKLYHREQQWYLTHNKVCRWEKSNED